MKKITDILNEEAIVTGAKPSDKEDALNNLIELIEVAPQQKEAVREAVFERERIISTGIGRGVATPHCKIANIDSDFCSLAILAEPIFFGSIDNIPVQIIFLLVSPAAENEQHLKYMSLISRILINKDFRDKLLKLESSQAVLNAFRQEEKKYQ